MRNVKLMSLAIALGALSFGSIAAEQMNTQTAGPAQTITVSASSIQSSSVFGSMNEKFVPDGTRFHPMTSVSGQRNMHSTSVVYE